MSFSVMAYVRNNFDRVYRYPYPPIALAWAAACGIDLGDAGPVEYDDEPDEDAELRRCRRQRYGVDSRAFQ